MDLVTGLGYSHRQACWLPSSAHLSHIHTSTDRIQGDVDIRECDTGIVSVVYDCHQCRTRGRQWRGCECLFISVNKVVVYCRVVGGAFVFFTV